MPKADLAVVILTHNERMHIARCVRHAHAFASQVFVVDSESTDGTAELARELGAEVFSCARENNRARQSRWAFEHLPFRTGWIMRLDAHEIVSDALAQELCERLPEAPAGVNGFVVQRRQVFMGRPLRWGGSYPTRLLRVVRRGYGGCADGFAAEHLRLTSGASARLEHDLLDLDLRDLRAWTTRETAAAVREAADILLARRAAKTGVSNRVQVQERSRAAQWWQRVYERTPSFVRPVGSFCFHYVGQAGFLDGTQGLVWHVFQAFWYRFLVDSIVLDLERRARDSGTSELTLLRQVYGLDVRAGAADTSDAQEANQQTRAQAASR